jgi:hypothetical protein
VCRSLIDFAVRRMRIGDGAWCWFNEPRALTTQGVTIVGWVGRNGDIRVASHDPVSGELVTGLLHQQLQVDDHANPAFYVRDDGRITAFYSKHAGSPLFYRTTMAQADVSQWGAERTIPTNASGPYGYTYPNPVRSPLESKLYLFWRGGNFLPNFSTTEDEGETWAPARTLIDDDDPQKHQRPYVKYVERDGVIHAAFTQAHPRNKPTSIFYVRYVPGQGWQRAGGAPVPDPPFVPKDGDRVYNAFEFDMRAWLHDVAVDSAGNPRLVFATFARANQYREHFYWHARWDGTQWVKAQIATAGPSIDPDGEIQYSAGIVFDPSDPNTLFMARKKDGFFQLERWRTADDGATWAATPVTTNANHHMRPVVPRGHDGGAQLPLFYMAGAYGSYRTYKTDVALRMINA